MNEHSADVSVEVSEAELESAVYESFKGPQTIWGLLLERYRITPRHSPAEKGGVEWSDADYYAARSSMRDTLIRHGYGKMPMEVLDDAFQHAVGVLSMTGRRSQPVSADEYASLMAENKRMAAQIFAGAAMTREEARNMVFDLIDAARYFERNPRDSYAKQEYDTQRDRLIAALIHEARQEGT